MMYNYKAKMSRITATNVDLDDINDFIEEYFVEHLEDWDNLIHCNEIGDDDFRIQRKCYDFIGELFNSSSIDKFDAWTDKYFNVDNISARLLRHIMIFNLREDSEDKTTGVIKPIRQIFNAYAFRFVMSNAEELFLDKFKEVAGIEIDEEDEDKKEGSKSAGKH